MNKQDKTLIRLLALQPTEPAKIAHITIITSLVGLAYAKKYPTPEGPWHVELTNLGYQVAAKKLLDGPCPECEGELTTCYQGFELIGIGCEGCGAMYDIKALAKLRKVRKQKGRDRNRLRGHHRPPWGSVELAF